MDEAYLLERIERRSDDLLRRGREQEGLLKPVIDKSFLMTLMLRFYYQELRFVEKQMAIQNDLDRAPLSKQTDRHIADVRADVEQAEARLVAYMESRRGAPKPSPGSLEEKAERINRLQYENPLALARQKEQAALQARESEREFDALLEPLKVAAGHWRERLDRNIYKTIESDKVFELKKLLEEALSLAADSIPGFALGKRIVMLARGKDAQNVAAEAASELEEFHAVYHRNISALCVAMTGHICALEGRGNLSFTDPNFEEELLRRVDERYTALGQKFLSLARESSDG